MYTQAELVDAINELHNGSHTFQNCNKLAAAYVVLDHISQNQGYSTETPKIEVKSDSVDQYGDSEFLYSIKGKSNSDLWLIMDELMTTLEILNPRLYNSVMDKIILL